MEVAVPGVPPPGVFSSARRGTHGARDLQSDGVEAAGVAAHVREQPTIHIPDVEQAMADADVEVVLVELAEADDVGEGVRYEVETGECLVLPGPAGYEHRAASLDPHDGAIPELDVATYVGVELGEDIAGARHVVGGPGIKVPEVAGVLLTTIELGEDLCLNDL